MTTSTPLVLRAVRGRFVVCRLDADAAVSEACLRALRSPGACWLPFVSTDRNEAAGRSWRGAGMGVVHEDVAAG